MAPYLCEKAAHFANDSLDIPEADAIRRTPIGSVHGRRRYFGLNRSFLPSGDFLLGAQENGGSIWRTAQALIGTLGRWRSSSGGLFATALADHVPVDINRVSALGPSVRVGARTTRSARAWPSARRCGVEFSPKIIRCQVLWQIHAVILDCDAQVFEALEQAFVFIPRLWKISSHLITVSLSPTRYQQVLTKLSLMSESGLRVQMIRSAD